MTWGDDLIGALEAAHDPAEVDAVRRRVPDGEPVIGVRMRDLFDAAKAAAGMPLAETADLFADPRYEVRMAAFCILDHRAKRRRTDDDEREQLARLYLGHHDRITTWDMVDRAAPSVIGGRLLGRDPAPLHDLARSDDPLRRRTAITAPLWFVRYGDDADLAAVFPLAELLADDPEPVVTAAVGIALKHAGGRDPASVRAFLESHGARLPAAARRAAHAKL